MLTPKNDLYQSNRIHMLPIERISPNPRQPRRHFPEQPLRELADSIRQHGVLQPLMVRPLASGGYQIVAGERRWRACRMAGWERPMSLRAVIRLAVGSWDSL